tara:strand:+ start:920 stop:1954 length:1035 start_codon:yes stop_codon:yes gene_type:complete
METRKVNINFVLKEMTALRYFMPLVIEANKIGVKSNFFVGTYNKYNCPFRYKEIVTKLSEQHGITLQKIAALNEAAGPIFYIESVGLEETAEDNKNKKYSITYMSDFTLAYNKYVNRVDHIIMPSKYFAEYYNEPREYVNGPWRGKIGHTLTDKNLYLGSPKYDIILDKDKILKKYNLKKGKKALVIFPILQFVGKDQIKKIYSFLQKLGFETLVKARGKDSVSSDLQGDRLFKDDSWYPHTTMELIEVADIVINFGSTTVKECIMLNTPLVDFDVKGYKHLEFLFSENNYCQQLDIAKLDFNSFSGAIEDLLSKNLTKDFQQAREKYLFEPKQVCKSILKFVL